MVDLWGQEVTEAEVIFGGLVDSSLYALSRVDWGIQWAEEMLASKGGGSVARSFNCLHPYGGYASSWRTCSHIFLECIWYWQMF